MRAVSSLPVSRSRCKPVGMVWFGVVWICFIGPGLIGSAFLLDLVLIGSGLVWFGLVSLSLILFGLVWLDFALFDLAWFGLTPRDFPSRATRNGNLYIYTVYIQVRKINSE